MGANVSVLVIDHPLAKIRSRGRDTEKWLPASIQATYISYLSTVQTYTGIQYLGKALPHSEAYHMNRTPQKESVQKYGSQEKTKELQEHGLDFLKAFRGGAQFFILRLL